MSSPGLSIPGQGLADLRPHLGRLAQGPFRHGALDPASGRGLVTARHFQPAVGLSLIHLAPRQGAPGRRALATRLDENRADCLALHPQKGSQGHPLAFGQNPGHHHQRITGRRP